jgi:hypothetical protein
MTDTDTTAPERTTRRDLAEGKIERVLSDKTSLVPMGQDIGGLRFENAMQMAEAAKLMSTAGPMLPPWLQGNVGGCWGIILRATELGISPLTLAQWSYVTENRGVQRVSYESQFFHAIIEQRAPITTRLSSRYEGEGDNRKCFVFATFKGETEPREWPPKDSADQFTLGKLRPPLNEYGKRKGSPLWDSKPDLQLFYNMSRDWARVFCPDVISGLYARDEFPDDEEVRIGPERARDVSPKLAERLRGPVAGGEGFAGKGKIAQHIDAAMNAARDPRHDNKHQPAAEPTHTLVPAGDVVEVQANDHPDDAGAAPQPPEAAPATPSQSDAPSPVGDASDGAAPADTLLSGAAATPKKR